MSARPPSEKGLFFPDPVASFDFLLQGSLYLVPGPVLIGGLLLPTVPTELTSGETDNYNTT